MCVMKKSKEMPHADGSGNNILRDDIKSEGVSA